MMSEILLHKNDIETDIDIIIYQSITNMLSPPPYHNEEVLYVQKENRNTFINIKKQPSHSSSLTTATTWPWSQPQLL